MALFIVLVGILPVDLGRDEWPTTALKDGRLPIVIKGAQGHLTGP